MQLPDEGLTERFREAVAYSFELHGEQSRKLGGGPYVEHLLEVCALVLEDGGDEDEAIAALLHDALEDQPEKTSPREIEQRFGERVLAIVQACSDTQPGYRGGEKPAWRVRKESYLVHLRCEGSRVALADKLHNARSMLAELRARGDVAWSEFNAGREEQLWFYRCVVEAFRENGTGGPMLDELDRTVTELEALGGGADRE
jgi:(p)ppGpp synthase/HD superfamily hydrolase